MSNYATNGYLIKLLEEAAETPSHPDHFEATQYLAKFRNLEATFFEEVHQYVDIGLAISEVQIAGPKKPNIFTVHGCRHIYDLIKSLDKFAIEIAKGPVGPLTVLESYILLCAAHVHDAANISRREDHPQRCNEIIERYQLLFVGTPTMQQIFNVASVHGGVHADYGKDTFRAITEDNVTPPRLPMLAALIRLSDELSENAERVPVMVAAYHEPSEESKLAYAYAKSFGSFEFRKEELCIVYNLYREQQDLKAKINGRNVSFYEFLEAKIDVIDRESRYCTQYARPVFAVGQIKITVNQYTGCTVIVFA